MYHITHTHTQSSIILTSYSKCYLYILLALEGLGAVSDSGSNGDD